MVRWLKAQTHLKDYHENLQLALEVSSFYQQADNIICSITNMVIISLSYIKHCFYVQTPQHIQCLRVCFDPPLDINLNANAVFVLLRMLFMDHSLFYSSSSRGKASPEATELGRFGTSPAKSWCVRSKNPSPLIVTVTVHWTASWPLCLFSRPWCFFLCGFRCWM